MGDVVTNFFEALLNILVFLPHYFSVGPLLRSLFSPWKNIADETKSTGFSIDTWFNHVLFNLISRTIGFFLRSSLLITFLLIMILYFPIAAILTVGFFLTLPIWLALQATKEPEEERKAKLKSRFISSHMLTPTYQELVGAWFENLYGAYIKRPIWWKLPNLLATPPLARDWTMGYTPALDKYTENLTLPSYIYSRREIVGREQELKQLQTLLSRSEEANAILVAESGVGKDAIIDAFAKRIYEGKTNSLLNYKRVMKVNMERIAAEFSDQKQREEFFEELLIEADRAKSVILVIENLDRYVHAGTNSIDLTVPLEKYADRSTLQIVGVCTPFAYEQYIFPHDRLNDMFTRVDVKELTAAQSLQVLEAVAPQFETRYRITIPYETLLYAIERSEFYIANIPFPEKAIQLLDQVCAYAVENKHTMAVPHMVNEVVTQKTHAPTTLDEPLRKMLINIETELKKRIVAQDEAVHQLSAVLRSSYVQLGKRRKPLASFLFLGPTGTGKTETARALAELFFQDENKMIRFDMSAFQTKQDIARLIGAAELNEPGLLTNAVRDNPYGVLLLDELEKAHKDLLNIFLTVLDEGYFTDSMGKRVDCKNLIIIATSNAGSELIYQELQKPTVTMQQLQTELISYLVGNHIYTPEFLNRFDGVITYKTLDRAALLAIAKRFFGAVAQTYKDSHQVNLTVTDALLERLIDQSYHPEYGARNMQRVITQEIQDKAAQVILQGVAPGSTIQLT